MTTPRMAEGDALLIVDVQNDFCPGGALPIVHGDEVVAPLNQWITAAREAGCPIIASRDWHPAHHPSFAAEGGPWPEHCVADTRGAALRSDLRLPSEAILVSKGTRFDKDQYSAFDETGLTTLLKKLHVKQLVIGGLALDVCVKATVLDARKAGFAVSVPRGATKPVDPKNGAAAIEELEAAGARFI